MSGHADRRCFALLCAAALALCACTPAPVLKTAATPLAILPDEAVTQGQRGAAVVWGGELLEVRNRPEASEMLILAYPLDRGQRPQRGETSRGRFVAVLPGYIERYDFPSGRFITITGTLDDTREELVGEQPHTYAVVKADAWHLWPPDFDQRHWHVSIGIGGAIR